jgi:phage terminase large subunit
MVVLNMAEKETRVVCLREVQKSIKDSVKQLIEDTIENLGWAELFTTTEQEIRGPHGSVCIFRGLQNHTAASIKSLEGFNIAWVEEAQTITQRSLDLLTPTIRAEGSELWFSWNPTSRLDPIDKMLRRYKPDNSMVLEANWRDNPYFPDSLRGDMVRDREQDPEKAAHIWDGEYAAVTGGAYYAALIADSRRAGRITSVKHDPELPVHTAWDLGIGDSMVLFLWQQVGEEIRVIDHYENHSQPIPHYVKWLEAKGYDYGVDWVPHDAKVRSLATGLTRVETMQKLGRNPRLVPNHKIPDGINALRELLPQIWFDADKCEYALECLMQYREDYDEKLLTLKSRPLHDWTSHTADAARYMAIAYREQKPEPEPEDEVMAVKPTTFNDLLKMQRNNRNRE